MSPTDERFDPLDPDQVEAFIASLPGGRDGFYTRQLPAPRAVAAIPPTDPPPPSPEGVTIFRSATDGVRYT